MISFAELSQLSTFNKLQSEDVNILPVEKGLSQINARVETPSHCFFVKKCSDQQTALKEASICKSTRNSAMVIEQKQCFVVYQWLDGKHLNLASLNDQQGKALAEVILDFHQSPTEKIVPLEIESVLQELIRPLPIDEIGLCKFKELVTGLPNLTNEPLVQCHGDLNEGNIFFRDASLVTLVDFEASALAPPAYDFAMMSAINNLSISQLTPFINHYQVFRTIDMTLINRLVPYCALINGLWFYQKWLEAQESQQYHQQSQQQFAQVIKYHPETAAIFRQMR